MPVSLSRFLDVHFKKTFIIIIIIIVIIIIIIIIKEMRFPTAFKGNYKKVSFRASLYIKFYK